MASPGPSDAVLLRDRLTPADTFSQFYARHMPGVLKFCARQGLSAHDAADLASEIFVAAMCSRYRFDGAQGESAVQWLFGIAQNLFNGQYRKSERERSAHARLTRQRIDLTDQDLADYAATRAEVDEVLAHIGELPPEQRAAVIGRHLEDAEYVQLAEQQGVSEQVVRQRVSRGLHTLRERMGSRS